MIIDETTKLQKEKVEIMKRIDLNDYKSVVDKQMDLLRFGEIENNINILVRRKLKVLDADVPKVEKKKVESFKEARGILVHKYTKYKNLTLDARGFVDNLVRKKEQGRDIMRELTKIRSKENVSPQQKISIINKILRF